MGDMADMMLDGTMCEICGVYLEEGVAQGFPRKCKHCVEDGKKNVSQDPQPLRIIVMANWLPKVLMEAGLVASANQGKQFIEQGGVRVNGKKVTDCSLVLEPGHYLVSVGSSKRPKEIRVTITKYAGG